MINSRSWDPIWEEIHKSREWGKYPSEDLVRFVARRYYNVSNRKAVKFLDLGCGFGAASWYLAREGFAVLGIDGSKSSIVRVTKRFFEENLKGDFRVGDFIHLPYNNEYFDCVIDLTSIQHNRLPNVRRIIREVHRVLKSDGCFFQIIIGRGSWRGPFKDKGYVHFFALDEVKSVLGKFKNLKIERIERTENNMRNKIIHWVVVCEKRV